MLWLKETSTYPQLNSQDRQQRLKGAMVSALRDRAALGAVGGGNGTTKACKVVVNGYLYRWRRLGSSSVLRKYLENMRTP